MFSNPHNSRGFGKAGNGSQTLPVGPQPKPKPPLAVMREDWRKHDRGQSSSRQSIEDRPGIEVRQRASLRSHGTMSPQESMEDYMQAFNGSLAPDNSASRNGAPIPDPSTKSQKRKYDSHRSRDMHHGVADDSGIAMFADEGDDSVSRDKPRTPAYYDRLAEDRARKAAKVDPRTHDKKPKTSSTIQSKNPSAPASTQTSRKPSADKPLRRKSSAPDAAKQSKPAHVQDQVLNLPPDVLAAARRATTDMQRHDVEESDPRAPAAERLSARQEDLSNVAEVESALDVQPVGNHANTAERVGQAKMPVPSEVDELASDPGAWEEQPLSRRSGPVMHAQVTVEEGSSSHAEVQESGHAGSPSKVIPAKPSSKEKAGDGAQALPSEGKDSRTATVLRLGCVCGQCAVEASDDDYTCQSMEDWVQEGKTRMQSMTKLFNSIVELSLERDAKIRHVIQGIEKYGATMDIKRNEFAEQQREASKWMSTGFWVKPEPQD